MNKSFKQIAKQSIYGCKLNKNGNRMINNKSYEKNLANKLMTLNITTIKNDQETINNSSGGRLLFAKIDEYISKLHKKTNIDNNTIQIGRAHV